MSDRRLMDQIFNLKFTSKQLVRASKKAEKDEKTEKLKVGQPISDVLVASCCGWRRAPTTCGQDRTAAPAPMR